jgi:hypothetical protein
MSSLSCQDLARVLALHSILILANTCLLRPRVPGSDGSEEEQARRMLACRGCPPDVALDLSLVLAKVCLFRPGIAGSEIVHARRTIV